MFKCTQCDKVYKTRTSLTRHTHNHATAPGQHACSQCGVVFARRDILNRHVNNGHCSAANSSRRRCHTACEGCRTARIKCDGQDPCHACASAGKACRYPTKTGRISQAPRPLQRQANPAGQGQAGVDHDDGDDVDDNASPANPSSRVLTPTPSPGSALPIPEPHRAKASFHESHAPDRADGGNSLPVAWPWLHENLFMENTSQEDARFRQPLHSQQRQDFTAGGGNRTQLSALDAPRSAPNHSSMISPLTTVVENLVAYAANTAFTPDENATRRRYWQTASFQLADIFAESDGHPAETPQETLHDLIRIYLSRFNPLWPLLNYEEQDADALHPVLFLTVSSIGAMFGSSLSRQYGTLMHQRLRRLLSASLYDLEGPDEGLIWLAQARMLTQVASLYFGQRQSFSYAQHLAAILVAQLRRMDCFREQPPTNRIFIPATNMQAESATWHHQEIRRRLAYGIFRTDVYTSILLGTRPLLTYEEIKMTLPRTDALWLNVENLDLDGRVAAQRIEDARISRIPFSDLVRIFLDRHEAKPPLSPIGYELSLFGLQGIVWSFSQDPELFSRITPNIGQLGSPGLATPDSSTLSRPDNDPMMVDSPSEAHRTMHDLHSDYSRLMHALDSWFNNFNAKRHTPAFASRPDTVMSSLLLYQLSRLRLCAPLEDLHHISYRAAEEKLVDVKVLQKVKAWTKTPAAQAAIYQAWDTKTHIESEFRVEVSKRARFNFLAFCSLHHSIVVLWTAAAAIANGQNDGFSLLRYGRIDGKDIEQFLLDCPQFFHKVSPLGGASFEAAAHRLWKHKFPWNLGSAG